MRILLADDSKTMRALQKGVLAALAPSIEFVEVGDGIETLCAIAASNRRFDLLLIDWNMPNMDGPTLVARVRQNDLHTPLIVCVTDFEKRRAIESLSCGVNEFLVKPFTPEGLLDKSMQVIQKARASARAA